MAKYNVDSLKAGIENCRNNIQVFQDAIRQEQETITQYNFYISEILRKEKLEFEAEKAKLEAEKAEQTDES